MPSKRTLVKATVGENCIGFRIVSWRKKSPQRFLIVRERLEELGCGETVIVSDIHSFAALRRNESTGMLTIDFTWLSGGCNGEVEGWEESVTVPYDALIAFMRESVQADGPKEWKRLSICAVPRPRLVFHDQKRLRECVANKVVRGKLAHALRDNFRSPYVEQINFYHDFEPYSFFFQEVRNGRDGMVGGLIFHNLRNDLKKAYYSVHT